MSSVILQEMRVKLLSQRERERDEREKIFGSSHTKMSQVRPRAHTWERDGRVNTTSWPCARQHATKTTCPVPWAAATHWLTGHIHMRTHTHRPLPRNKCHFQPVSVPMFTGQMGPVGQREQLSSWKLSALPDSTVNKAKHLNRTRSRRKFPWGVEPALVRALPAQPGNRGWATQWSRMLCLIQHDCSPYHFFFEGRGWLRATLFSGR